MIETLDTSKTLAALPPEWPEDLLPAIRSQARASDHRLVVLDDDPTGTQTVHGLPVLTGWSVETLKQEFERGTPTFYILTNSRGLSEAQARQLAAEVGANLTQAAALTHCKFSVVSRSDSTLRGHFPAEVETLAQAVGGGFDAWLIVPFFLEGGRITLNDVHYVANQGQMVPAGETEFARDATFGYRSSNLRDWVEEKTAGRIRAEQVCSISIRDIRQGGPEWVAQRLAEVPSGATVICNAASYRDMEVLAAALTLLQARGKRYLYRTAASFVRVMAGQAALPLLTKETLQLPAQGGGLIVAGSHVARTTAQLEKLRELSSIQTVELDAGQLAEANTGREEVERTTAEVNRWLSAGQNVLVYTSRQLITGTSPEHSLEISRRVSAGLVEVVAGLSVQPRYLIAKGGITSSDVATQALKVERADVLGQILPGVPVWRLGPETRFPGMVYVVFPGNVGTVEGLSQVVQNLAVQ